MEIRSQELVEGGLKGAKGWRVGADLFCERKGAEISEEMSVDDGFSKG